LDKVKVTVYGITGRQLFFTVDKKFCEECDLSVDVANKVANEVGSDKVSVEVRPWLSQIFRALLRGGYHPPVVLVDGKVITQGVVPSPDKLRRAIEAAIAKKAALIATKPQSEVNLWMVDHAVPARKCEGVHIRWTKNVTAWARKQTIIIVPFARDLFRALSQRK
jgi:hypothetical protein